EMAHHGRGEERAERAQIETEAPADRGPRDAEHAVGNAQAGEGEEGDGQDHARLDAPAGGAGSRNRCRRPRRRLSSEARMSPEPAPVPCPSVSEVDEIAAAADPVLRNLRITLAYHDLSAALSARLGPGANWCTFATWASRQAGHTIRGEDLARKID